MKNNRKIKLYLFDSEADVEEPRDLKELRNLISTNFILSAVNTNLLKILYNDKDDSIPKEIIDDNSFNNFKKKKIPNLYLDIGENPQIFDEYINLRFNIKEEDDIKLMREIILLNKECKDNIETSIKTNEDMIEQHKQLIQKLEEDLANKKQELKNKKDSINNKLNIYQTKYGTPFKLEDY